MKDFKWNRPKEQIGAIWNYEKDQEDSYHTEICSDRDIIANPGGFEYRVIIEALCRTVSELIESVEENERI